MSELPQQNTIVQYVADGISAEYIVPFYTPVESTGAPDLDVFTQAADAPPVPESDIKLWNIDYTFTSNLDPVTGGVINFLPGRIPPSGYIVTIVRNVSASLDVEFSDAQTFSGYTLDAALDKLLLISQQNKSYTLGRNLSYIVNSYLPESTISSNVQIPVLGNGQVWYGSAGGVIAVTLEQSSDTSTLRSELANEQPVTNGASLVGYYDEVNLTPTTVADQLTYLTGQVVAPFPTGSIIEFGGAAAPAGFLVCDGSAISRSIYDDLYGVIGTTWGSGDGSTTFNLPNFQRRVSVGSGGVATGVLGNSVGSVGGNETHVITSNELPSHTHGLSGYTGQSNNGGGTIGSTDIGTRLGTTNTLINSTPNNAISLIQPSAVILKIIKT